MMRLLGCDGILAAAQGAGALKRVLIAYSRRPPIIEYLKRAFESIGIEAD